MEGETEKEFTIVDPIHINTVVYLINETPEEFHNTSPKYTVERLDYKDNIQGKIKKRIFQVTQEIEDEKDIILFSFGKNNIIVNNGVLGKDKISIFKNTQQMKYNTVFKEVQSEYKDFNYTPNLKRPISIIDPETGLEIKPKLYFDETENTIKGKCDLKPYKSYFAFEIKGNN